MQCCWNLVVRTRVDQSWAQQTQRVPKLPPLLLPMAQNYGEMDACHHHDFSSRTVALAYIDFGPCMRESRCPRMENSIKNQDSWPAMTRQHWIFKEKSKKWNDNLFKIQWIDWQFGSKKSIKCLLCVKSCLKAGWRHLWRLVSVDKFLSVKRQVGHTWCGQLMAGFWEIFGLSK